MKIYFLTIIFLIQISTIGFSQSERKSPMLLWNYKMPYLSCSNVVVSHNKLYVNCFDKESKRGMQYAIDKNNGNVIWESHIDEQLSAPLINRNYAYFGSKNNKVIALDTSTGKEIWQFNDITGAVCFPPALINNRLYFGTHTNEWCIINPNDGKVVEINKIGNGICCRPTTNNQSVFYTDWDGKLHRFNTITLTDSVIYKTNASSHVAPEIKGNIGFMTNDDNSIISVDLKTGKEYWSFKTDGKLWRPPAIADNICIVITDNSHVYSFESTSGKLLWDIKKSGLIYTSPTISKGIAYISCGDKNIYAYDTKSGKELWKLTLPENAEQITIDNEILYFSSGTNIYAYKK